MNAEPASPVPAAGGYRRAVSSLGAPELDLEAFGRLAARHGLTALELRCLNRELHLPAHLAAAFGSPEKVRRWLVQSGMSAVSLDTSFKLVGAGAGDREKLLEFIPWAEGLGTPWLRIFDGGTQAAPAEMEEAVRTLQWWRELRAQHRWRVDLMVETHDSLFTAERIRRLVAVAPEVRILWDSHHTWKLGGESPAQTWEKIGPQVVHIHVKDSVSRPGARLPYTYVLPGTGEFPMVETLAALQGRFTGCVSLEWERLWHQELPDLDSALWSAQDHRWW